MGAIASGGVRVLNERVVRELGISRAAIDRVAAIEQREMDRRERDYRGPRPQPEVRGKIVILVDDGLATGSSMRAAVAALRKQEPVRIVVAVPIGAPATCDELAEEADEIVCAETADPFFSVGLWYENFSQTTDEEIRNLLETYHAPRVMR